MGGTSSDAIGQAVNGVPLCGSGTTGCHGWTEHHPLMADLLGWRLTNGRHYTEPWYARDGWRRWVIIDGEPFTSYVELVELDRQYERGLAVAGLQEDVARRAVE
jgi:hypothetical protein